MSKDDMRGTCADKDIDTSYFLVNNAFMQYQVVPLQKPELTP